MYRSLALLSLGSLLSFHAAFAERQVVVDDVPAPQPVVPAQPPAQPEPEKPKTYYFNTRLVNKTDGEVSFKVQGQVGQSGEEIRLQQGESYTVNEELVEGASTPFISYHPKSLREMMTEPLAQGIERSTELPPKADKVLANHRRYEFRHHSSAGLGVVDTGKLVYSVKVHNPLGQKVKVFAYDCRSSSYNTHTIAPGQTIEVVLSQRPGCDKPMLSVYENYKSRFSMKETKYTVEYFASYALFTEGDKMRLRTVAGSKE